jgi:hypothetical protein
MTRSKIVTNYEFPPIPPRDHDWSARRDDSEPDDDGHMMQGWGPTEQEAVADLLRQEEEEADALEYEELERRANAGDREADAALRTLRGEHDWNQP